jgi:RHS repeat-associated protein
MGCPKLHEGWRFVSAEPADVGKSPFLFSSEYLDSETNLVYYNYRYYSPELGRWTKRDPIGEKGGMNAYEFSGNNTSNFGDMNGLYKIKWTWDSNSHVGGAWYSIEGIRKGGLSKITNLSTTTEFFPPYTTVQRIMGVAKKNGPEKQEGSSLFASLSAYVNTNEFKNVYPQGTSIQWSGENWYDFTIETDDGEPECVEITYTLSYSMSITRDDAKLENNRLASIDIRHDNNKIISLPKDNDYTSKSRTNDTKSISEKICLTKIKGHAQIAYAFVYHGILSIKTDAMWLIKIKPAAGCNK